jgi:hypothetical protein
MENIEVQLYLLEEFIEHKLGKIADCVVGPSELADPT